MKSPRLGYGEICRRIMTTETEKGVIIPVEILILECQMLMPRRLQVLRTLPCILLHPTQTLDIPWPHLVVCLHTVMEDMYRIMATNTTPGTLCHLQATATKPVATLIQAVCRRGPGISQMQVLPSRVAEV